jgi:hypothetical protein
MRNFFSQPVSSETALGVFLLMYTLIVTAVIIFSL